MSLMSSVTGGASARVFAAHHGLTVVTTDFTMGEARQRVSRLIARYGLDPDTVADALTALPVLVYPLEAYESHLPEARGHIEHLDPKDVRLLALVLKLGIPVWSHDGVFDHAPVVRYTTGRLLNELEPHVKDPRSP